MEYYCNDTSDVLISCGGGELMCEDLPMWILKRSEWQNRNGIWDIRTIRT